MTDADIIVDTGGFVIEIECKTSRSDLFQGEKRKDKHKRYAGPNTRYIPNQFYICVPTELVKDAIEWVEKTNPKYGVIECMTENMRASVEWSRLWERCLRYPRKAKLLHEEQITPHKREQIVKRAISARANYFQELAKKTSKVVIDEDYCI